MKCKCGHENTNHLGGSDFCMVEGCKCEKFTQLHNLEKLCADSDMLKLFVGELAPDGNVVQAMVELKRLKRLAK